MKIGLVLSQPPSYSETFFNSKVEGLKEYGYSIILYVQKNDSVYESGEVVVAPRVCKNKLIQFLRNIFVLAGLLFYFKRILKFISLEKKSGRSKIQILKNCYTNSHILKSDLDWLHFGFATMSLQSENIAKVIGAKMAVSFRGYDMDVYPIKHLNCYNLVWENVDKVHAISEYMLAKANSHGLSKLIPSTIIYPAMNSNYFKNIIQKTLIKDKLLRFTTVARLHWVKGIVDTLEALSLLKEVFNSSFKYTIIGNGFQYEEIAYAVHQLDLVNEVEFKGELEHSKVINYLKKTDVYIQYSYSEGYCNAVLEAQAMGCLCVVSDGGALSENVIDKETGWVVPKRQPQFLAETLNRIINYDDLIVNEVRDNAKKRIHKEFNLSNQIESFINFYNC